MISAAGARHDRTPIDHAVLADLRDDVGERALHSFIRTYIDLLISRLAHVERAVARHDCADALQDVPDMRTSSAMLGAERLVRLTEALEYFLRRGRIAAAAGMLPGVRAEAASVIVALRAVYGDVTELQPPNR
ncbi:MAG TPA: Hpt domain-containing protein [Streptosporangiaceae bacterium]|nr:Hpt domain-containing protein [Streptosporangiaceae bacterium]